MKSALPVTGLLLICVANCVATAQPPNNQPFYDPIVRDIEGWQIKVDPALLTPEHRPLAEQAFAALGNHLQRITYIVPADKVAQLRRLPIWIDQSHELKSMQYHPGAAWLKENGYDPRLVKHVHIPRAAALLDRGTWAKHPYVILHELAHAYHDQVLGFEEPEIKATWEAARDAGILKDVLLYTGRRVDHYGLTNHKEYFAESTEAYFGVNDFYPFVRAELKEHDPRMFRTLQTIWGPVP